MKNFENVYAVKKKVTTIRIITGIIALLILPVLIANLYMDFGATFDSIMAFVVSINTTLCMFAGWVESKLKNVY